MSISKIYDDGPYSGGNWEMALKEVQAISYSLEQSIGLTSISPKYLKKIEAQNQVYYHASECQTPEETDKFVMSWCEDMNVETNTYRTGGGLGFDWHIDRENKSVTITLVHPRGWHKDSTLLAKAWLAGYRGDLDFEYSVHDASLVVYATDIQDKLTRLHIRHVGLERCLEAVRKGTVLELIVEVASEALAVQKKRDTSLQAEIDNRSDDELLGTSGRQW
jgi:hypothetical protein